ncbi:DUF1694 domain-containing protein [Lactiplantibacillus paraplantarum]|uniref:DUF1694 domain-containing protein n=1 Tax=Lactiplantibacillus paraplantarum TaxID=60520 RepID=A0A4Q9Y2E3_9LACO|nr:DUF1694 domain-containing protein [Lactiplantibacillus paraplantarum]
MQNERQDIDKRLQNAVFGVPLLRPDEQHRCLGTFYERIELRISFAEALRYDCVSILQELWKVNTNYQLLMNGQLDMDIMGQYIRSANQYGVMFAIKTSQYYLTGSNNAAVILCADHALDRAVVDVLERYPKLK